MKFNVRRCTHIEFFFLKTDTAVDVKFEMNAEYSFLGRDIQSINFFFHIDFTGHQSVRSKFETISYF